jgi:FkbM family methyltransferase
VTNLIPINAVVSNTSEGFVDVNVVNKSYTGYMNYGAISVEMISGKTELQRGILNTNENSHVQKVALDELMYVDHAFSCPSFVKLDIEGHELLALIGARKMLTNCQPVLFLEAMCKCTLKSLFALLDSLGYALAWFVLPHIDTTFKRFDRNYWEISGGNDAERHIRFLNEESGTLNIMAVPKHDAGVFDDLNGNFHAIDLSKLRNKDDLDIKDSDVSFCMNNEGERVSSSVLSAFCIYYYHENCEVNGAKVCNHVKLDSYLTNYWESILLSS